MRTEKAAIRRSVAALALLAAFAAASTAGAERVATPVPVTITASPAAPWIVLGSGVGITGRVKPHPAGVQVSLQLKRGGSWLPVGIARVGAGGAFSFAAHPGKVGAATYRVVTATGTNFSGASDGVMVDVLHWIYLGDMYARPSAGDLYTEPMAVSGGANFAHPVALDAGCYNAWGGDAWVDYPLGRKYEVLTATMAIGGYAEDGTTASYSVIGDGKTLASGNLVPGTQNKIKVSLSGVSKIRLLTNVPDPTSAAGCSISYTQVVFGDAELLGP